MAPHSMLTSCICQFIYKSTIRIAGTKFQNSKTFISFSSTPFHFLLLTRGLLMMLCVSGCSVWDLFFSRSYLLRVVVLFLLRNLPKKKQPAIENLVVYCDVIWTRIIIENSMIESSDITFLDCMDIVSCSRNTASALSISLPTHSLTCCSM